MSERVRVQFEMTNDRLTELDQLKYRGKFESRRELFNAAFELLDWAVEQAEKGRDIASLNIDDNDTTHHIFALPVLLRLQRNARKK